MQWAQDYPGSSLSNRPAFAYMVWLARAGILVAEYEGAEGVLRGYDPIAVRGGRLMLTAQGVQPICPAMTTLIAAKGLRRRRATEARA